jgi:hypothetical protein
MKSRYARLVLWLIRPALEVRLDMNDKLYRSAPATPPAQWFNQAQAEMMSCFNETASASRPDRLA